MDIHYRYRCVIAVTAATIAMPAEANMGLPLIAVLLPPLWLALLPIIVVEAAVIARLNKLAFRSALGASALANVASTLIGVPFLWLILATAELVCCGSAMGLGGFWQKLYAVTVQAPWLIPYESEFRWMVPAALVTMAVWCAGMSVLVETPIVTFIVKCQRKRMWLSVAVANIASYLLLGLTSWLLAVSNMQFDTLQQMFMPLSEKLVDVVFLVAWWLSK